MHVFFWWADLCLEKHTLVAAKMEHLVFCLEYVCRVHVLFMSKSRTEMGHIMMFCTLLV